jgi:5-methylcytosine-specific restriction protein B
MIFERRSGIFKQLCTSAQSKPDCHFYLIIDEINRGDLPRIFGELLTAIELDKRDKMLTLPNGLSFSIPKNVFIVGTMNTADRSISLMDTALRRRFGFIEVMPDSSTLGKHQVGDLRLGAWLDALNVRIRRHLKRDGRNLQIGHAYLLPLPASVAEFARILRDDIIPLLEEYCYSDFNMLQDILGKEIVDTKDGCIREDIFLPNSEGNLIQCMLFEEMQPHVLDQEPTLDTDLSDAAAGDNDDDDHAGE